MLGGVRLACVSPLSYAVNFKQPGDGDSARADPEAKQLTYAMLDRLRV